MKYYLIVALAAMVVTLVATPVVRRIAISVGAITAVRERDVHTTPTPRLGGVAIWLGLAIAVAVGSQIDYFNPIFAGISPWAIVLGSAVVCLLGAADDIWDLDWLTKLVGQALAAVLLAWQGVQLFTLPIAGLVVAAPSTWLFISVLVILVAMNAVNFVDGLDGLAAGMIAISATAFFVYTYLLAQSTNAATYANNASFILVALVGACLGFLPYNFHRASIFMGDSGSMVLGLVIAGAAIVVTGQIDPAQVDTAQTFPVFLPMLLPVVVLLLPLLDMGTAVVRRLSKGQSPFAADRMHLHHRLLQLGHSQRRAVLILYLWTALFSFCAAAMAFWPLGQVGVVFFIGVVVALVLTLGPLRKSSVRKIRDRAK